VGFSGYLEPGTRYRDLKLKFCPTIYHIRYQDKETDYKEDQQEEDEEEEEDEEQEEEEQECSRHLKFQQPHSEGETVILGKLIHRSYPCVLPFCPSLCLSAAFLCLPVRPRTWDLGP